MCADIYVFDANQEMVECCACKVPANSVLRLSLKNQLIQRPLTGQAINAGSIYIIGDRYPGCNETVPHPTSGLVASKVQVQLVGDPSAPTPWLSESNFQSAPLTPDEQNFLALGCAFTQYLGSRIKGKCICGLQPGS